MGSPQRNGDETHLGRCHAQFDFGGGNQARKEECKNEIDHTSAKHFALFVSVSFRSECSPRLLHVGGFYPECAQCLNLGFQPSELMIWHTTSLACELSQATSRLCYSKEGIVPASGSAETGLAQQPHPMLEEAR